MKAHHEAEYAYHRQCAEDDLQYARNGYRDRVSEPEQPQPTKPDGWWLDCGEDVPFDEPPSAAKET